MDKERLERYQGLLMEQKEILDMIGELEAVVMSPRGQKLDGMPRNPTVSDNTAMIAKWIELREEYIGKSAKILDELVAIERAIEGLDPVERVVLRRRYINGDTLVLISNKIGYSYAQTKRIAERAVEKIEKDKR